MLSSPFTIHEGLNGVLNFLSVVTENMTETLETEESITVCPIF